LAGLLATAVSVMIFAHAAFAKDDVMEKAQILFKPIPYELKEVKGIRITPELVALGKALYFDPRLSKSGFIQCCRKERAKKIHFQRLFRMSRWNKYGGNGILQIRSEGTTCRQTSHGRQREIQGDFNRVGRIQLQISVAAEYRAHTPLFPFGQSLVAGGGSVHYGRCTAGHILE
jgi:hypothetical protein